MIYFNYSIDTYYSVSYEILRYVFTCKVNFVLCKDILALYSFFDCK